jgi:23S rRNA (uracil1939-C5)-methyltransferase
MDKTAEVKIEKIVSGGKGMGHLDGKVVFADYCAVGDTALIKAIKEKKSYILGEVVGIKEPSADRVALTQDEFACRYFTKCGGCSFWHVDYDTELNYKKGWFIETVNKIGKFGLKDVEIIGSSPCTNYRNRAQFKVRNVGGDIVFGFYKRGTNYVIDIDGCLIIDDRINEHVPAAKSLIKALRFNDKIPQVDFTVDDEGKGIIMVIHVITDDSTGVRDTLKKKFSQHFPGGVRPFIQTGRKKTIKPVFEDDTGTAICYTLRNSGSDFSYKIRLSPGSFLQVNYAQNIRLVDEVLDYLDLSKDDRVLDLFCGAGNFSFAAAHFCGHVTGVESYPLAVADALKNKEFLGVENVDFIRSDAVSEAAGLADAGEGYDCVIIDPPRQGAISALKGIKRIARDTIVYVSCDAATFARDAAFLKSAGFDIESVCLVDMFPRTYHVESVAKFRLQRAIPEY